jgi:hypothetical protein
VVVVLPASMWAIRPIFLIRPSGIVRAKFDYLCSPNFIYRGSVTLPLPPVMSKGFVSLGHPVGVFSFLNCRTPVVKSIQQFPG